MKVLCIGNSFSDDASRYLHQIARADKEDINVANLMIGGCFFYKHFRNFMSDAKDYTLGFNGKSTGVRVTMTEVLLDNEWDYVSIQQASAFSPDYDTYQPYADLLCDHVRECVPKSKLVVHETWAYKEDSNKLLSVNGAKYTKRAEMYKDIRESYQKLYKDTSADLYIESGTLFQKLVENGISNDDLHRDEFHASFGLGRYALGLLWYKRLTGNKVTGNTFRDFDQEIPEETVLMIQRIVDEM